MPQSQKYRKYNLPVSNPEPNTTYVEFRTGLYITGTRIMRYRPVYKKINARLFKLKETFQIFR